MLRENDTDMDIKLAAPTGKAAMRLAESIVQFLPNLPEDSRETIPTRVQTLHRLLGMRSNGRSFRYNRDNLISADVLIVDEVSMIDLTMIGYIKEYSRRMIYKIFILRWTKHEPCSIFYWSITLRE